jgi:DNA-binding SARP family transcriptional activator
MKLHAFGDPTLRADDGTSYDGLTRQTKRFALLIYLACSEERTPHRRDELIATFWPESSKRSGLNSLRQALFVIRRELGADVTKGFGSQDVSINWNVLGSDVDAFYRALGTGSLEAALGLYRGDFLSGFYVSGASEFSFWVEEQRARLKDLAGRASKNLARRAEAEQSLPDAVYWWRRAFEFYPYDESTLCRIISLLAVSGNRAAALAEFERFRRRADRELGVAPSPLTMQVVNRVVDGAVDPTPEWLRERRQPGRGPAWSGSRRATDRATY